MGKCVACKIALRPLKCGIVPHIHNKCKDDLEYNIRFLKKCIPCAKDKGALLKKIKEYQSMLYNDVGDNELCDDHDDEL